MLPELSAKVEDLLERVSKFMDDNVYPNEKNIIAEIDEGDRWQPSQILEGIKAKAKEQGLWNLFLPDSDRGAGLTKDRKSVV
jgi:acyl-CoA dehydrogenase